MEVLFDVSERERTVDVYSMQTWIQPNKICIVQRCSFAEKWGSSAQIKACASLCSVLSTI